MIPKRIHYCWFGRGEKTEKVKNCIASWKKYMSEYEIIEWNEDNFDINMNPYTKMCYEQRKFAFLTDYLRLIVIERYGGIYFDTDVEVVKNFDALLDNQAFFGFENDKFANTGQGFGAEPHNIIVQQMIKEYECLLDGTDGVIGCPILNTRALMKFGLTLNGELQVLDHATVYPADYFNPRDSVTGETEFTNNTYSIHWYAASWMPWYTRLRKRILKPIHRLDKKIRRNKQ